MPQLLSLCCSNRMKIARTSHRAKIVPRIVCQMQVHSPSGAIARWCLLRRKRRIWRRENANGNKTKPPTFDFHRYPKQIFHNFQSSAFQQKWPSNTKKQFLSVQGGDVFEKNFISMEMTIVSAVSIHWNLFNCSIKFEFGRIHARLSLTAEWAWS